nr:TIGR02186 family protein [Ancylobacter crimeensis]
MPARAKEVVLSLSKDRVTISSSFSGEDVALFGVIGRGDAATPDAAEPAYDVIVTVRGPNQSFTTWRKERRLGLWMNVDSRAFVAAPSYLAVLSNRPPEAIAAPDILRQEQAGFAHNHLLQRVGTDYADVIASDPFRQAFLRVKKAEGLYFERTAGVEFIAPYVFRASIPIPGRAPVGDYQVVAKVFADGQLISQQSVPLHIAKVDFEQAVATAAREHAVLYGFVAALGALAVGWLASVVFRRD